jgi:hypothetical protein
MDTTNHNDQTNVPALQVLDTVELQQVEGGEVTTAAIVGTIALGGLLKSSPGADGVLLGWGLYELTR